MSPKRTVATALPVLLLALLLGVMEVPLVMAVEVVHPTVKETPVWLEP